MKEKLMAMGEKEGEAENELQKRENGKEEQLKNQLL